MLVEVLHTGHPLVEFQPLSVGTGPIFGQVYDRLNLLEDPLSGQKYCNWLLFAGFILKVVLPA